MVKVVIMLGELMWCVGFVGRGKGMNKMAESRVDGDGCCVCAGGC